MLSPYLFITISLSLFLGGCATSAKIDHNIQFFQGKASDECEFLGWIDSSSSKSTEEESFKDSKTDLSIKASKYKANALKLVNVNRTMNKIQISAEAYRCSSLIKLKVSDENRLDFNF